MGTLRIGKGRKRIPDSWSEGLHVLPVNAGSQPTDISAGKSVKVPHMGPGVYPYQNVFALTAPVGSYVSTGDGTTVPTDLGTDVVWTDSGSTQNGAPIYTALDEKYNLAKQTNGFWSVFLAPTTVGGFGIPNFTRTSSNIVGTYNGSFGVSGAFSVAAPARGDYIFGAFWGFPNLIAEDLGDNTYRLRPNQNGYADNPGDSFWRSNDGAGPYGNKWMEQNIYLEQNPVGTGSNHCRLKYTVLASDLHPDYDIRAYIQLFQQGYAPVAYEQSQTRLSVGSGEVGKTLDQAGDQNLIVQCGFRLSGVNANPVDEASLGSVTVKFDLAEVTDLDNNKLTEDQSTGVDLTGWNWTGGNLVANGDSFTFTASADNPSIYFTTTTTAGYHEFEFGIIENTGLDTNWAIRKAGLDKVPQTDYSDSAYQSHRTPAVLGSGEVATEFYLIKDGGLSNGESITFTDVSVKWIFSPDPDL